MNCPECHSLMVRRSRYVWSKLQKRFVVVYYWRCIECGNVIEE